MDYYLGQIGVFGFNFAPKGWAQCTGTILNIAQNTALYALLGTNFGGNGQTTFGLPDLRSRTPLGFDGNYPLGEMAGTENVTLSSGQMPQHTHLMSSLSTAGTSAKLDGRIFAQAVAPGTPPPPQVLYGPVTTPVVLNTQSVSTVGGNQSHNNIQPSLAVNFCIATTGYFPSRN